MIYLFFDTETTGLPANFGAPATDLGSWDSARLVQLGWILEDDRKGVVCKGNFIVRPDGFRIPDEACKVHGITTEKAEAVGLDCKKVVYAFLGQARLADVLVGHNVGFDINVVGSELFRYWGKDYLGGMPVLDTMKASVDYCQILTGSGRYKWPKLVELHQKLFGCEFDGAHDAMADITATRKCFWELRKKGLI